MRKKHLGGLRGGRELPKEKVNYRETLVFLTELFDGKMIVNVSDVARAFKIDRRTAAKRYPFERSKIELTRLASVCCLSDNDVRAAYKLSV